MADFTPSTIPLGSLAEAAAAGAEAAQQEQQIYAAGPIDIGTTTGIIAYPPDLFLP
jgi:hypothetical protein